MMKRIFIFLWLWTIIFSVRAQPLEKKLDALIQQSLPDATIAVLIQDPLSGEVLYARNTEKKLMLASGTKLFAAAAAWYQLGENYRYATTVLQSHDTFYIRFTGAPDFTSQHLQQLLSHLKAHLRHPLSKIVIDTTRFQPPDYPKGIAYEDLGWYYAAPCSAVIINENAVPYEFTSAKTLGGLASLHETTDGHALQIIHQVKTVSLDDEKNHCGLNIEIYPKNTLKLYGCITATEKPVVMRLAIPSPILFAKQSIVTRLKKLNVPFQGQIIQGKTPSSAITIATVYSRPLQHIMKTMLHQSNDIYAASLTKLLGFTLTGEGTFKQGAFAIKAILAKYLKFDTSNLELTDGIGTRFNLISTQQVVNLLSDLYRDKKMYAFMLKALPRMGVSGSLANRMKNTPLEKRVYAKTGTMHDLSSLSGYFVQQNKQPILFSIIINDVTGGIHKAKELEEKILLVLNEIN